MAAEDDARDDFVSDKEIARRWKVSEKTARTMIRAFEKHPRFPKRDALAGGKRFWPAVVAFMRARYHLGEAPLAPDGPNTFENDPARRRKRVLPPLRKAD